MLGCGQSRNIGDGYEYNKIHGSAYNISNAKHRVPVAANVSDYRVNKDFIIGLRQKVVRKNYDYSEEVYGYFILDKMKQQLEEGLTIEEFKTLLGEKQIALQLECRGLGLWWDQTLWWEFLRLVSDFGGDPDGICK